MYGLCALVQFIQIWDFFTHYKNNKSDYNRDHSFNSEHFDEGELNKKHAKSAIFGIIISVVAFIMIILDMTLIPRYTGIGNYFFNMYFVISVFI